MKCGEVIKGVDFGKAAGVDQAHEKIADICAALALIEQRIFPMEDRSLENLFTQVVIKRRTGNPQK